MAFVTPVVELWLEREIAQWVHPMKDRSDDPSHHERTLLPRSYISLPCIDSVCDLTIHLARLMNGYEGVVTVFTTNITWLGGEASS